jgi:hypothetical protein
MTAARDSRLTAIVILSAILALAAGLRLVGVTFGLPAVYNPDEVAIMARSLAFAKGDLNPHNFLYPTFYFYVLAGWIALSFVAMWITGMVSSLAAFQALFFTDPSPIYLAGRILGVACGVAGVAGTWRLGRRIGDDGAGGGSAIGLTAALFLAVAPTHVRDSHYIKHDVPVTLVIALAQIAILRLMALPRPTRGLDWPLSIAAAACGVAFSTHYYAVFLAIPLVLAIIFRTDRPASAIRAFEPLILAGVVTAVVFFALSPFLLVEPRTAWQDIIANRQIVVDRAAGVRQGAFASAGAYARMLWDEAVGWPVVVSAGIGLVWLARERWRTALVLAAFPVAFLLFISNTVAASRYLNPVLPTICALGAFGLWRTVRGLAGRQPDPARVAARPVQVTGQVTGQVTAAPRSASPAAFSRPAPAAPRVRPRSGVGMGLVCSLLCALPGLDLSVQIGRFFQQDDTRTLAQRYIERQMPPGSTVLIQPYSVPLAQSRESLREALTVHFGDPARASTKFALRLQADPYPAPAYRTLFLGDGGLDQDKIYLSYRDMTEVRAATALREAGVQFVVLKQYNVPDPAVAPLRAWLAVHGRRLEFFTPYHAAADGPVRARVAPFLHNTDTPYDPALERPGPGLEVWQVDAGPGPGGRATDPVNR